MQGTHTRDADTPAPTFASVAVRAMPERGDLRDHAHGRHR